MKGVVLDVLRSSFNDGPGIRTTIFLKGCPLRCAWCHNPETMAFEPELAFSISNCMKCMACADVCPNAVHEFFGHQHKLKTENCKLHGACVEVCQHSALKIYGKEMHVDEVLAEALKDVEFYRSSGGGITLSGGEPMAQFDFACQLLKKAKEHGIHTCLDTSGYASTEKFSAILPIVDLFHFDIKHSHAERHKKFTGVDNKLILKNLQKLSEKGAGIVLRCPLIKGVNNDARHLEELAKLSSLRGVQEVHLLPYHISGHGKSAQIGRSQAKFEEFNNVELQEIKECLQKLTKAIIVLE